MQWLGAGSGSTGVLTALLHLCLCVCMCVAAVNRQINDKERACAAMENPELRGIVEECLKEVEC